MLHQEKDGFPDEKKGKESRRMYLHFKQQAGSKWRKPAKIVFIPINWKLFKL